MARQAPVIEITGRTKGPNLAPAKRSQWPWMLGLVCLLAMGSGVLVWFHTQSQLSLKPGVPHTAPPVETISTGKTGVMAVATAVNSNTPVLMIKPETGNGAPAGPLNPKSLRSGNIRVKAVTPEYAASFLAGTRKRLRYETNAWQTISAFPHSLASVVTGPCRVCLEVDGFNCSSLTGTNVATVIVEGGRTNALEFMLSPKPATLILSCNVTNALAQIENLISKVNISISVPSLRPLPLLVSAPGYRKLSLKLDALAPDATARQQVTLERETGGLRVMALTPDYAKDYLAKTGKKITIRPSLSENLNDPEALVEAFRVFPHAVTNLSCGETWVAVEAEGFDAGTVDMNPPTNQWGAIAQIARSLGSRITIQEGLTAETTFTLLPKPAKLTLTCNVTNALLTIGDRHISLTDPLSLQSLQSYEITVSANGYASQVVKLDPMDPGKPYSRRIELKPVSTGPSDSVSAPVIPGAGKQMKINLGEGAAMEFLWVEALKGWVGKYEVTNSEFRRFMPDHYSGIFEGQNLDGKRQSVVEVDYHDAVNFCGWLNRNGTTRPGGFVFRLPTTNEWLTVARCGDARRYPWGDKWPPKYGNYGAIRTSDSSQIPSYDDGCAVSCDVERSGENDWGFYGVGGNVWEWLLEGEEASRSMAGASWANSGEYILQVDNFNKYRATSHSAYVGFRVVLLPAIRGVENIISTN